MQLEERPAMAMAMAIHFVGLLDVFPNECELPVIIVVKNPFMRPYFLWGGVGGPLVSHDKSLPGNSAIVTFLGW